ncbi:Major Facilitator Superfamily protein [Nocardioides dokdonensis FR1436]|uniref:Major Facilitator Superfamily protein n=1 Tax=Nocardioides dokdonensis FR1436 TaxID=1300347 RepID=A0A1A9GHX6_9ACTN|nr:MFS transporter [Nocardioides dokdonensis]ANH37242.1 Major Facilitator Superfamily protein [Nocardioides dokdonensis FR1436]
MPTRASRLQQFKPPTPLAGQLSVQSVLFAVGDGAFLTASAVFFTIVVGLSPAQVGVGITVAGIASFLVAVPAGKLADRVGPQRLWAIGAVGTSAAYAAWPWIDGFVAFLVVSVVLEVVNSTGGAARGAYVLDVLPRSERIGSQAYMYAATNLGFTLGAGLGGLALAFDSDAVLTALPLLTAALGLGNAYWITRLPKAPHKERPSPLETAITAAVDETDAPRTVPGALRNPGYLLTSFFSGVLMTNQVLLHTVIPLWLVVETDAPRVLLAALFGTNTVMCIFLPMAAARTVRDVPTALRAARVSSGFFVVACAITMVTHDTLGWRTIALVWAGHIAVTGAELFLSAASWAFESELSDPDRRGEYQGAGNLGGTLGYVWAPAAYTYLALGWGTEGWLVIAAIIVVAAVLIHPSARMAQRFLERHELDPAR